MTKVPDQSLEATLRGLLASESLEDILEMFNLSAYDTLVTLYEIGELDLERFAQEDGGCDCDD